MDGVSFPKQVYISNPMLGRCYICLTGLLVTVHVWTFFYYGSAFLRIPMNDYIHISMWVEGSGDHEHILNEWQKASLSDLCKAPHELDFWYTGEPKADGSESVWKYENYSCLPLCVGDLSNDACLPNSYTYRKSSQEDVVLYTSIRHSIDYPNGTSARKAYLLPTVNALKVKFAYSFAIPKKNPLYRDKKLERRATFIEGSSREHVQTIVLDHERNVNRIVPTPNDGIAFTVPEMLALAGVPDLLDQPQLGLGKNIKPNASSKYPQPAGWISGSKLEVRVLCYDEQQHVGKPEVKTDGVCYVTFENKKMWNYHHSRDVVDVSFGADRIREKYSYYGLKFAGATGGEWSFLDYSSIYFNVVASMVFLTYVKPTLLLFVVYCLGKLSCIYSRAIYQDFNIGAEIGTLATHLVVAARSFQRWQHDVRGDCIEKHMLQSALCHITDSLVRSKSVQAEVALDVELEPEDLDTFVSLAYGAIVCPSWLAFFDDTQRLKRTCLDLLRRFVELSGKRINSMLNYKLSRTTSGQPMRSNTPIRMSHFLNSYSRTQDATFLDLVDFVNVAKRNEKRQLLEWLFTPAYIERLRDGHRDSRRQKESTGCVNEVPPIPLGKSETHEKSCTCSTIMRDWLMC